MTTTCRVVFADNSGSFAADAIASSVGGRWSNAVQKFDGEHDLAFIEVPADSVEYFESCMEEDENVISYGER